MVKHRSVNQWKGSQLFGWSQFRDNWTVICGTNFVYGAVYRCVVHVGVMCRVCKEHKCSTETVIVCTKGTKLKCSFISSFIAWEMGFKPAQLKLPCLEIAKLVSSWSKGVESSRGTDICRDHTLCPSASSIKCLLKVLWVLHFFSVVMILTSETALVLVTKGNI